MQSRVSSLYNRSAQNIVGVKPNDNVTHVGKMIITCRYKLFVFSSEHDRKSLSVEDQGNSCCFIKKNNDVYCLPTDSLFLEWIVFNFIYCIYFI